MEKADYTSIIETLEQFVSEHRQHLVNEALTKRTRHLTLAFEDIEKPHNVSAVVRTAECLGIQDLHFIKNKNDYEINANITQGAAKWLSFHHYRGKGDNVSNCYDSLRKEGYKIYATSLHETSNSIYDLDATEKTAIVFGTESDGISKEAGEKADGFVHIPMNGFTESFNLSVTAALCINTFHMKLEGEWPKLSDEEQMKLKSEWYRRSVREADLILKTKGITV